MFSYPYNPKIHNLGNVGFKGAIHAEMSPIFTKLIDIKAYNNRNIRQEILDKLENNYPIKSSKVRYVKGPEGPEGPEGAGGPEVPKNKILDLCCGIGISTAQYGIDTSPEMINKAKRHFPNKKFAVENAENFWRSNHFEFFKNLDIITCMFAFHEMPEYAHEKIIDNSLRLASKKVLIMDISPEYKSSKLMLDGEPYLIDYQKSIEKTMDKYSFIRTDYIPNHVTIWEFDI